MEANRGIMENQLEKYEAQLVGLKSFLRELNDKTAEH